MTPSARPAEPSDRVRLEAWLGAAGHYWAPGRSFVCFAADGSVAALVRLAEPPPGDGHHREHVRTLLGAGEAGALIECAILAGRHWDGRLEGASPGTEPALERALAAAGMKREATLTRGWAEQGRLHDLHLWGRAGVDRIRGPEASGSPVVGGVPREAPKVRTTWADASLRPALERFLRSLVPGRAYGPGTLLSEAERLETLRRGALDATWIVAIAEDAPGAGEVVGGLVLEREKEPERAHVRRVHLDVAPDWQGRGVAAGMLRHACLTARARIGALVLEADPREGNRGACGALLAAGFETAGVQRGAWRLRRGAQRWDEDVLLYRRDVAG